MATIYIYSKVLYSTSTSLSKSTYSDQVTAQRMNLFFNSFPISINLWFIQHPSVNRIGPSKLDRGTVRSMEGSLFRRVLSPHLDVCRPAVEGLIINTERNKELSVGTEAAKDARAHTTASTRACAPSVFMWETSLENAFSDRLGGELVTRGGLYILPSWIDLWSMVEYVKREKLQ